MTKRVISVEDFNLKELESKIAPSILTASLFGGVDTFVGNESPLWDNTASRMNDYLAGDSQLWENTVSRMEDYLGFNYDPMGIINANYTPEPVICEIIPPTPDTSWAISTSSFSFAAAYAGPNESFALAFSSSSWEASFWSF